MKEKDLFIVESPFQMLSASEAIKLLDIKNYFIFLRLNGIEKNDIQMKKLSQILFDKDNIKIIQINKNKKLFDYIKLIYYKLFFSKKKNINRLFIGNYESNFCKLIYKKYVKEKVFLLDDGNKTIEIQKKFSDNYNYNIITCFPIEAKKNQIVYKYDFIELYKKIQNNPLKEYVLFIGVDIVEQKMIDLKTYKKQLLYIKDFFNKDIVYIPHRNENQDKLKDINEIVNIKYIDYPIEIYGLEEKEVPSDIVSYFSSALYTMQLIYKNSNIKSFYIKTENKRYKDLIENIYTFQKKHMGVLYFND